MRKVLKSQELFHFWANKIQAEGRCGNTSFQGNDLYSYSTVIARHLPDGSTAISTRSYSVTTSSHQSDARRALPDYSKLIQVHQIGSVNDVFSDAKIEAATLQTKALTARTNGDLYRMEAKVILEQANRYAAALGSAERLEIVELTAEQQEAHKTAHKAKLAAGRAFMAQKQAEAEALAAKRLTAWMAGDTSVSSYTFRNLAVRLRILGNEVQTTQGASIPIADAIALWPIIERCRKGDKSFTPRHKLGNYQLTKIREDGGIVVGCHDIKYSELARMAVELKLQGA